MNSRIFKVRINALIITAHPEVRASFCYLKRSHVWRDNSTTQQNRVKYSNVAAPVLSVIITDGVGVIVFMSHCFM